MRKIDVLIVGGGVTGLSTAAHLEQHREYLLIEGTDQLGGYCKTLHQNGFVWDYSGHFFHFRDSTIRDWMLERMDCPVMQVQKITDIQYGPHLVDFPFQYNIHQLPLPEFIQCLTDLVSVGEESRESFKSWIRSRLGDGICDKFLIPYNEKLYATDLDNLDPSAMGRFFPAIPELKTLLNHMVGKGANQSYNDHFIYPTNGAYEFIRSILTRIDDHNIQLNTRLTHLDPVKRIAYTNQGPIQYNQLVSTLPFNRLLESMGEVNDELSWNRVAVFNLGFDQPTPIQTHWRYFPDPDTLFYRVGFYNNIHQGDRMSLYVEIGLQRDQPVQRDQLLQRVLLDLERHNIIQGHQLTDHQFLLMDPAYVHITPSSQDRYLAWQRAWGQHHHSIGRYGAWTYCSIEDNIQQAREVVLRLIQMTQAHPDPQV